MTAECEGRHAELIPDPSYILLAAGRIKDMRISLHAALGKANAPGEWGHVLKQIGMFSFTGLTPKQVP